METFFFVFFVFLSRFKCEFTSLCVGLVSGRTHTISPFPSADHTYCNGNNLNASRMRHFGQLKTITDDDDNDEDRNYFCCILLGSRLVHKN